MKTTNLKTKSFASFLLVLIMTFVVSSYSFAYVEETSWGVNPYFPNCTFYNSDGSIKTVYTTNNQFVFTLLGNQSNSVYSGLTQVYLSKETKVGSGKYEGWFYSNVESWCATAGGGIGGVSVSPTMYRVTFPQEGRYKVLLYTFDQYGTYLYSQQFVLLYSNSMVVVNPNKIVNDTTVDTAAFTNTNGYWSRVNFTVHDLSGQGLTTDDIILKLCNMNWMRASRGHASTYTPTDITITRSTVNPNEYFVGATIYATLFDNVSGEYYIECSLLNNNSYKSYSGMFPHLFIN